MGKIISLKSLGRELKALRKKKTPPRVVFTNGCFDIIHAGHVRYLKKAKSFGDILIVGLNSDSSVKEIKGEKRPIVPEKERAEVMAALSSVDYVCLFKETTPVKLIAAIKPGILVKGADWAAKEIAGADIVKKNSGRIKRITLVQGQSTTNIIKRILELHREKEG